MAGTYGFDAATPQTGLDWGAIPAERQFVIVKATGSNVGLYVAPAYAEEHDAARRDGLQVGHYHLTGTAGTIAEQAAYFVHHLRSFDEVHDWLALDNERFPDEPGSVMWSDDQVAEFWRAVFTLLPAFPHHHAFTYGDESHLTALAPWDRTNALGTRWWVANYHANDGTRGPLPVVPGCQVAIHQYASVGRFGGKTVDLDWSPMSLADLAGSNAADAAKAKAALAKAQAASRAHAAAPVPKTLTSVTGVPGPARDPFWKRMQMLARLGGYAGVIDGDLPWGGNSWKGVQRFLAGHYGYRGRIDGEPMTLTYEALQRYAAHYGYTGPIDGDLRVQSWKHVAVGLNTLS